MMILIVIDDIILILGTTIKSLGVWVRIRRGNGHASMQERNLTK